MKWGKMKEIKNDKVRRLIHNPQFIELIKYGFFGGITTALNLILFVVLEKAGIYYLLANTIAYFIAVVVNYYFSYKFVFERVDESLRRWNWKEFIAFLSVRIGSLLVDNALFFVVVDIMHVNVYLGRILLSMAIIMGTYVINKIFIFKKGDEK